MKGLILSGGGSAGAFQVGALQYLIGDLRNDYDSFFGVSVGGINASFFAQYNYGETYKSIRDLTELWNNISSKDIYSNWALGKLSVLFKPSFYDGKPLYDLIHKHLDKEKLSKCERTAYVGSTSITSGNYRVFSSKDINFIKGVVAGASFPLFLSPIEIDGEFYSDGATIENAPFKKAIELGCTELDIILTSPARKTHKTILKPNILDSLLRVITLSTDQILDNDLENLLLNNKLSYCNPELKNIKINIIRPDMELIAHQMSFNHSKILEMQKMGYEAAKIQYRL